MKVAVIEPLVLARGAPSVALFDIGASPRPAATAFFGGAAIVTTARLLMIGSGALARSRVVATMRAMQEY